MFEKPAGELYDWEIFNGLGNAYAKAAGAEYKAMPAPMAILAKVAKHLENAPHGVDLGPLAPSLLGRLETADTKIHCAPEVFLADLARVKAELIDKRHDGMKLVGRRHLRSNNSWLHNSHRLVKGPRRDQVWIHPEDAAALGVREGDAVVLRSAIGSITPTAHLTDRVARGVACLPHGFSQRREGVLLAEASRIPGESYNDLSEEDAYDVPSGNAAVNALPIQLERV